MTGFLPKDLKSSARDLKHGFRGEGRHPPIRNLLEYPPGGVAVMKRSGVIFLLHVQLRNLYNSRILEFEPIPHQSGRDSCWIDPRGRPHFK